MPPGTSDAPDAHMSASDTFAMQLERDPLLRATVVAVALFDRPPLGKSWSTGSTGPVGWLPISVRSSRGVPCGSPPHAGCGTRTSTSAGT